MKTPAPSRPSEDAWRCVRVNAPRLGDRYLRASGWFVLAVSAAGEAGRHQTALRGRAAVPSGRRLSLLQATPQKPLRADEPVKQSGELDALGAGGVRHSNWRRNRDLRESGATAGEPRRLSSCALGRRAASVGRWSGFSRWLTIRSPVRGPIQAWWGRACAAARRERSSLSSRSRSIAVAGVAPVRPIAPRSGPEFRGEGSDAVHLFSFGAVWVLSA